MGRTKGSKNKPKKTIEEPLDVQKQEPGPIIENVIGQQENGQEQPLQ